MRHTTAPVAFVLATLLALLVAAPVSAATTTVCGEVTAFAEADATTEGLLTIGGTDYVIPIATVVTDAAELDAIADAGATTCVNIETDDTTGLVLDISIAAQAQVCGDVTLDAATGVYAVNDVALPAGVVDADLMVLLDAAIAADAEVCAQLVLNDSGAIVAVDIDATINLCGEVTLDADSVAIAGVDLPLALLSLDAEAMLMLELAAEAGAEVCLQLVVDDTTIVQANLSADIFFCGEVTFDAEGNAVVDGVTIDAALLEAGAEALLELAASADGEACVTIVAVSSDGNTSVTVSVTVEVCAEVTAIGDGTITLDGVTLGFAGAADSDIEVGDVVCVLAGTGPTGDPVVTDVIDDDAAPGDDDGTPGDDDDDVSLPDTSTGRTSELVGLGIGLLAAAFVGGAAMRRFEVRAAR